MPKCAKATLALRYVGAVVISILVTSSGLTNSETTSSGLSDQQTGVTASEVIVAISQPIVATIPDTLAAAAAEPVPLQPELATAATPDTVAAAAREIIIALAPPLIDPQGADRPVERLAAPIGRFPIPTDPAIIGIASFYDDPQSTASGEQYDPNAFTAAAQLAIRDKFGGIRFGRKYQPAYGLAEYEGKKVILKFNDVGPLRPGRKFDLSRAAMAHFGGLDKGLLPGFKVTPLRLGHSYPVGPITDDQLAALFTDSDDAELTTAALTKTEPLKSAQVRQPHPLDEFAFVARPLASPAEAILLPIDGVEIWSETPPECESGDKVPQKLALLDLAPDNAERVRAGFAALREASRVALPLVGEVPSWALSDERKCRRAGRCPPARPQI
jgi:hypothetical protein